jgi:D-amino-acid oxidase
VLVVGAGVSGLTTAIRLAESGLNVTVRTDRPPGQTTSSVAGAIWGPHLVEDSDRVTRWASRTLDALRQLADDPASGVTIASGVEASRAVAGIPGWRGLLGEARPCAAAELPPGFGAGWRYAAPIVSMPDYLGYLADRFRRAGGLVHTSAVTSFTQAAQECGTDVVVNCTGAAARHLVPDPSLTPVRGQMVMLANPGISEFFIGLDENSAGVTYFFPHRRTVLLGGTEEHGCESLEPDPVTAQRIMDDCAAIEPRLAGAQVLAHRVGLRPVRPAVRLEAETLAGRQLLHNYGHGGAGITLSWGCADEVAGLLGCGS